MKVPIITRVNTKIQIQVRSEFIEVFIISSNFFSRACQEPYRLPSPTGTQAITSGSPVKGRRRERLPASKTALGTRWPRRAFRPTHRGHHGATRPLLHASTKRTPCATTTRLQTLARAPSKPPPSRQAKPITHSPAPCPSPRLPGPPPPPPRARTSAPPASRRRCPRNPRSAPPAPTGSAPPAQSLRPGTSDGGFKAGDQRARTDARGGEGAG